MQPVISAQGPMNTTNYKLINMPVEMPTERWKRSSFYILTGVEWELLQRVQCHVQPCFVRIFKGSCLIRTAVAKASSEASDNIPIVLVHGFASGLGLWCKNFDALAKYRCVYAFDLLGFGRSSRANFPKEAYKVEQYWIDSVEEWRKAVGLEKFILLGHSLGGYISTAYAIAHPERVAHLILADPWGFSEHAYGEGSAAFRNARRHTLSMIKLYYKLFTPLGALRSIGPVGRRLIHRVRSDLRLTFDQRECSTEDSELPPCSELNGKSTEEEQLESPSETEDTPVWKVIKRDYSNFDGSAALDYLYYINLQKPSGEIAFKYLCPRLPVAENPMINRIEQLDSKLPITFIFGSRSWIQSTCGEETRNRRPNSYVDIKILENAGHHVYADVAGEFNRCVNEIAGRVDACDAFKPITINSETRSEADSSDSAASTSCSSDEIREQNERTLKHVISLPPLFTMHSKPPPAIERSSSSMLR